MPTRGRAAVQFPVVHSQTRQDLEVDTECNTPGECAALIRTRLAQGPGTTFDELRHETGSVDSA
jgi:chloramphenicol 3-O phosphotransferase